MLLSPRIPLRFAPYLYSIVVKVFFTVTKLLSPAPPPILSEEKSFDLLQGCLTLGRQEATLLATAVLPHFTATMINEVKLRIK